MRLKTAIFSRLLGRAEPIVGLEIADDFLRLAYLDFDKKKSIEEVRFLSEEQLPDNTTRNGIIINEDVLLQSLKKLLEKTPLGENYVILSLPIDKTYTKLFSFPPDTPQEKLDASMKLITEYQMPFEIKTVYMDWERCETKEKIEFVFASIPKSIVDQYLNILSKAGLKTVAVEIHPLSFLRTIELPENIPILIVSKTQNASYVYIVKDKILQYSRVLPFSVFSQDEVKKEIKRIADFYEAKNEPVGKIIDFSTIKIAKEYKDNKWLISIGAAKRGLLPRAQDRLISLMPIGTEKAYEYQRANAFSRFLSLLTIWLSIFFCLAYIGTWFLMFSIHQRTVKQIELLTAQPLPSESAVLEIKAQRLNNLTLTAKEISRTIPNWSILVKELQSRVVDGITINNLQIGGLETSITLTGVARKRPDLSLFKKSLEESEFLKEVVMPLTSLEQKEDIPFSVSFKIKDPQLLLK